MKPTLILLLFIYSGFVNAKEPLVEENISLDPAFEGSYSMVIFSNSSTIFSYLLNSETLPFNYQLLYKMRVTEVPLVKLVADNSLVTLKTKTFNLQTLLQGKTLMIEADIYIGDYRKDGVLVYENMLINFSEQLYLRPLDNMESASKIQQYDVITYRPNKQIYIHKVQKKPSYDHLIHIDLNASCMNKFKTSSYIPKRSTLQMRFSNCGSLTPFYYQPYP